MNLSISMSRQGLFIGAGNGLELFATVGGWTQGAPVRLTRGEVGGWRNYRLQLGWFMLDWSASTIHLQAPYVAPQVR